MPIPCPVRHPADLVVPRARALVYLEVLEDELHENGVEEVALYTAATLRGMESQYGAHRLFGYAESVFDRYSTAMIAVREIFA